jgi:hypothetical protein
VPILILCTIPTHCDRCGESVPTRNDTCHFDIFLTGNPACIGGQPRHLLPVVRDGVVICPGSPSRAQYIEGQPRDPRPRYAYDPKSEQRYRDAWRKLQEAEYD